MEAQTLHAYFFASAASQPDADAVWVDGRAWTYAAVEKRADEIADRLKPARAAGHGRCLLFAYRSLSAYCGLLGILQAGLAYVPLNPKFPAARNQSIIERSGAQLLLVDARCEAEFLALAPEVRAQLQVLWLDRSDRRMTFHPMPPATTSTVAPPDFNAAYVLFTSGSTGVPKGVKITHANACTYIDHLISLYPADAPVRHTQLFELTFDLSVHDLFYCWAHAGCIYVPSDADMLQPDTFIVRHALTHWFSVPSLAGFMLQLRKLRAGVYPSLRMSMFCGESLPYAWAQAWSRAAANSRLINLYGPTEATIAFTHYAIDPAVAGLSDLSAVPIGTPLPGQEALVVDRDLNPVPQGSCGELLLGGTQLAAGYISDHAADHERFFQREYPLRRSTRWYRSGDLVVQTERWGFVFHGRLDAQIKLRGYRVELQEVEHVIRSLHSSPICAVLPWPLDDSGNPLGLVAFVQGKEDESLGSMILRECRSRLPEYACPEAVVYLESLPLNSNGKIDRAQLRKHLTQPRLAALV